MTGPAVTVERHGTVALLVLDRTASRNALSRDLVAELTDRLADAAVDDAVRAVVLAGGEKAFCAGADIGECPP